MAGDGPRLGLEGLFLPALRGIGPALGLIISWLCRFCPRLKFLTGVLFPALSVSALSGGVIGLASPMSVVVYFGGNKSIEGFLISEVLVTATSFSSFDIGTSSRVDDVPELLLFPRLIAGFSGFLFAITNSGSSFNWRLCLRRIINQNTAKDAIRITAIGITIAGINVLRLFEVDFDEALVAFDVADEVALLTLLDEVSFASALDSDAFNDEY